MSHKHDVEEAWYWQAVIRDAARRLKEKRPPLSAVLRDPGNGAASFALFSDEPGGTDAGIELALGDGHRLRIGRGVDQATLRSVLAVLKAEGC